MKRTFLLLLAATLLFACTLTPVPLPPAQTPVPTATALPTATVAPLLTEMGGYMLVYIHLYEGAFNDLLAEHARRAAALGQQPIAYFTAHWCPSCRVLSDGLSEQHPALVEAFEGVYLICINVDEWGWGVPGSDFPRVEAIPAFYRLDNNGRYTGDSIDGSAWEADTPENIARVMGPWLHR